MDSHSKQSHGATYEQVIILVTYDQDNYYQESNFHNFKKLHLFLKANATLLKRNQKFYHTRKWMELTCLV